MVYGIGFSENNNLAAVSWTGVTSIGLCYTLYSVQLGKTFLKYVITSSSMITPIQGTINWLFSPICNQWDTHTHTHTHSHTFTDMHTSQRLTTYAKKCPSSKQETPPGQNTSIQPSLPFLTGSMDWWTCEVWIHSLSRHYHWHKIQSLQY